MTSRISLTDILGLALHKKTYRQLCDQASQGHSLENLEPIANTPAAKHHREKILRAESTRQFSHNFRPVIEFILNAIDARPDTDKAYDVYVTVKNNNVLVKDPGSGMGLEDVLQTLLVPFQTKKDQHADIGRFGVGFFSGLGYCLQHPNKSKVKVQTTKDGNQTNLTVAAKASTADSLLCDLAVDTAGEDGTMVSVNFPFKRNEMIDYIRENIQFIDPSKVKVYVNGKLTNDTKDFAHFEIPVEISGFPKQTSRLSIKRDSKDTTFSYSSHGVRVWSNDYFPNFQVNINHPNSSIVVEGRDQFKGDLSYNCAIEQILEYVCSHVTDISDKLGTPITASEFIPSLIRNSGHVMSQCHRVLSESIPHIFGDRKYIVDSVGDEESQSGILEDFLGSDRMKLFYVPRSKDLFDFWKKYLGNKSAAFQEITNTEDKDSLDKLPNGPYVKNLSSKYFVWSTSLEPVTLKESIHTISPFSPRTYEDRSVLVNVDHPLLKDDSFNGRYMLKYYLLRTVMSEPELENKFI
ncbi:MAG: hypothetical protein ACI8Y7_001066 [Candidatus Woesearchaeota archaeon]|jgi:hypothetical protein